MLATWLDVAPVVISGINLFAVILLGGGGLVTWRQTRLKLEEERRNYWKGERQAAYASAMKTYLDLFQTAYRLKSELRPLARNLDAVELLMKELESGYARFDEAQSVIQLLATEDTLGMVDSMTLNLHSYWTVAEEESRRKYPRHGRLESELRKITTTSKKMQNAFRIELGLEPLEVETTPHMEPRE